MISERPRNLAEAVLVPVAIRAQFVLDDPYSAGYLQPEKWPEVERIAKALQDATGSKRLLARYAHDAGVKAVVVLYATGYMPSDLERAVRLVTVEPWWRADGAKRGLASLTPEVVARTLQTAPAESMSPRVVAALARAQKQLGGTDADP